MDENKSPQDILNEIFEKSQASAPPPPQPQLEPDRDSPTLAPPPDEAAGEHGANASAKPLPWLCLVLGAALLVMGVCVLQVVGMNHRLDELQNAVEAMQNVDSFTQLQADLEAQTERADQAERDSENLLADRERVAQELNILTIQKWQGDYLFYIGQFMDNGDYPMAALVIGLSADRYFTAANLDNIPVNPAQMEQYQTYKQKLIDEGYLLVPLIYGYGVDFSEQWDPEQNPDMAALGILWCAMEEHYVLGNSEAAAQYLLWYQWFSLGESGEGSAGCYPQRVRNTASGYVIQQYERLIQDLAETGWVEITADGILDHGAADTGSDILYDLPFTPPGQYLYGSIPLT